MSDNKKKKLKGKRRKSHERKVADQLVKQYDTNEFLKSKKVNPKFLDLFN